MRLARLTLSGFKSFADTTEFTFDEAITGVVGPNGCGKSNIVDAIKWVLGERSSKSLRGKEMIDVIFAGSAGRKAAGMAAVTLAFENPVLEGVPGGGESTGAGEPGGAESRRPESTEPEAAGQGNNGAAPTGESEEVSEVEFVRDGARRRALPIDADMVEVERRLYRDGTSQYLINGKRARLRDIRDLFLDTGIGADAYSIIEQGKVDAMLLASPQERRTIFEEAAGVAKYKQRRIEAQRKLERAQANLAVTREQLASTERRLRIVKGQAAKARRFKELDADLRALRLALMLEQYDDIRSRLEGLTSRLSGLEQERSAAAAEVGSLEAARQDAEIRRHEAERAHRVAQERRQAAVHAGESATQRLALTERARDEAGAQARADADRLADLDRRLAAIEQDIADEAARVAALAEELAEREREVDRGATERAGALARLAERQASLAERRSAVGNIERERAGLAASIEGERRRAATLRERRDAIEARRTTIAEQRSRHEERASAAGTALEERRARVAELERDLAAREGDAARMEDGRRSLAERVVTLAHRQERLDGRRATLAEMAAGRVGLGEAVRFVLGERDAGRGFAGVIAPLAELVQTDRAHAAAVEAALGDRLRALVVGGPGAMPSSDELARMPGRATFMPLGSAMDRWSMPGTLPDEPVLVGAGRVVPLARAVRPAEGAPAGLEELVHRLLGGVYLVETMEAATLLGAASPATRFVTRRGEVIDAMGAVSAGPMAGAEGEPAGVLQRRSELEELSRELAGVRRELESERAALAIADAEVASLQGAVATSRAGLVAEQRALAGEQARAEQLAAEGERLGREAGALERELAEAGEHLASATAHCDELAQRADRMAGLHAEQSAAAESLAAEVRAAQVAAEATADRVTAARIEAGRIAEQAEARRREHRRLVDAGDGLHRDREQTARMAEQSAQRRDEHARAVGALRAEIEAARAEAEAGSAEVESARSRLEAAAAEAEAIGRTLGAARERAGHVERDWHSVEVSRRELEVRREGLEERAQAELGIDVAREHAEYRAMMADASEWTVGRLDQAAATAEIDTLREQIRALGSVNLEALEEETQLVARNEDLVRQVADIDAAAAQLGDLIERLNVASRERFGEVFAAIQANFAGQDGMFRKLFGGGRAEVRLMPLVKEIETPEGIKKVETGETDLLESGVEVIAKPPGKEPRSISQLSGGEKTLTAVALLLAIFKSKPSCFCVLDEVDAALDDANVGRYCAVVREFTTHSHFIVITHNKKTMQNADRLFGVTMQERGVSTRVTVKFDRTTGQMDAKMAAPPPLSASPDDARAEDGAAGSETPRKALLRRALAGMRETKEAPATT
ncbi:MAG: chromosome segregation protein SMC [Phycisphaerae bacterium]|nr:chromosome segregation protein SMC [Phycisphaerae bacterium]